jgi:hypothetical protein
MRVADTLSNILENPIVETVLDRSKPIDDVIEEIKAKWQVNLDNRNPAPAYTESLEGEPIYKGTDFDMFTFMNALCDRKAVINLPSYDGIAPSVLHTDQTHISENDRHGQLLGLIANKEALSFNIRIKDYQVVQIVPDKGDIVGAPRNFALVDYNGVWNGGLSVVELNTSAEENNFLTNKGLWKDNKICFENFVHPNLSFAFFGSRYLATKFLSDRIEDEAKYYRGVAKKLRKQGIKLGGLPINKPRGFRDMVYVEKIKVEDLEARLLSPGITGEYPIMGKDGGGEIKKHENKPESRNEKQEVLRFSEQRARDLSYKLGPQITASVRAVELAFFLNGFMRERKPGNEKPPGWDIPEWERGYKTGPRTRTELNALKLTDEVTLAYRIRDTTVTKAV